ncbi:hypothetical protein NW754_014454 [Fusarium falciforme]|nr:hypothetical protein NW754_014454 [Fusarium falciforme]
MAAVTRQPFAPLDGARLQNLTSLKNRQNALPPTAGKRKAELIDTDDSENIDPSVFAKRSKASSKDMLKPSAFVLKAAPIPAPSALPDRLTSPTKTRRTLQPKSPASRLSTGSITKSSPLYAPRWSLSHPNQAFRSGLEPPTCPWTIHPRGPPFLQPRLCCSLFSRCRSQGHHSRLWIFQACSQGAVECSWRGRDEG